MSNELSDTSVSPLYNLRSGARSLGEHKSYPSTVRFTRCSVDPNQRDLVVRFALLQLVDAAGNVIVPKRYVTAHLDHLRVPRWLQPLLPGIKAISSVGLLLGL